MLAVQWLLLGLGLSLALSLLWRPPSHPLGDVIQGWLSQLGWALVRGLSIVRSYTPLRTVGTGELYVS